VRTIAPVAAKLSADNITNVHLLQADMIDHQSLKAAAKKVEETNNGALDYLIVNGVYNDVTTLQKSPTAFIGHEDLLRQDMIASLDVNVIGVIHSINAFLPLIKKGSVKKIVAISTAIADSEMVLKSGIPGFLTYATTKAALNMVVVKYSIELKNDGVTVLALSPGLVNTREVPGM
jgi:NAD(P)-dependent dehydrogenase (short-subunit alcohol dehydrogenase family)